MQTITRLFDHHTDAVEAVRDLGHEGFKDEDISILANNEEGWHDAKAERERHHDGRDDGDDAAKGAASGAGIGAALGGGAGLLTGLGMLAIPGVGPVVAAGWLASTAVGAAGGALAGGATGGLIGALTDDGVDEDEAHVYAEGVRRGGTLVSVRAAEDDVAKAIRIMASHHAVHAADRGGAYRKAGWTGFDPKAPAYSRDQIARERDLYRRPAQGGVGTGAGTGSARV